MTQSRRAFTLVEASVTLVVAALVLGVALGLLWSGGRLYVHTLGVAQGRQAAILFFDALESDLAGCTVLPGLRADPVAIGDDGSRIAFFRADAARSTLQVTVAVPVEHGVTTRGRSVVPTRNGEVRSGLIIESVKYELVRPDPKAGRSAWLVRVDARFPTGERARKTLRVVRLFELIQPTTTLASFHFQDEIPLGSFVFTTGSPATLDLLSQSGLRPGVGAPASADVSGGS